MITAVVLVPAAPWLIPSVAPSLLAEQETLRRAIGRLIESTDAPRWGALGVASVRSRSRWDRELPVELGPDPYRGGGTGDLPGSHWVARAVLGSVPLDAGVLAPQDAAAPDVGGKVAPADPVASGLAELQAADDPVALLVVADGATAHGEHAPGAADPRAAGYDEALHAALAGGPRASREWAASAAGSVQLAAALGATLPTALRAVLDAVSGPDDPWETTAHELVVPYGVGHHVVRWGRR